MATAGSVKGHLCGEGAEADEVHKMNMDTIVHNSVDVEFIDITLKLPFGGKKKRTILKGVSGHFRSGEVTAIMGPSGAGKSSLMNALTGFCTRGVTGTLRVGDSVCEFGKSEDSLSSCKEYRKKSCYILQDDRLSPLFTVGEIMKFSADMKLGSAYTDKVKQTVITEVLDTLGLSGTENTRCLNLSGGQRKRLSIALELVDNPPVLFLDEPTTGLDCLTAMQCIGLLKSLARSGRTIVCSIHQPSAPIYMMFDQVFILAEGMRIYNGAAENTVPFLASVGFHCPMYHNPADYVLEVANGEYGNYNERLAAENSKHVWTRKPHQCSNVAFSCGLSPRAPPHEIYKFMVLYKRCIIQMYRDWTVTHLKILLHILIGILFGLMYQEAGNDGSRTFNNLGFLIISCTYLCYTSIMPAILKFPSELSVLKKENFNNWYSLQSYYAAVLLTGMPMQIWFSVVYSIPAYFLTGQPQEMHRFLMFVVVLAAITLVADAVGNVIGSCVNPINGTFWGAILTCAMIVFAGFLALLSDMHPIMRFVANGSFLKYGLEALVLAMYSYNRPPLDCPEDVLYCHLKYPKEIIKQFSFKPGNYWLDVAVLAGSLVAIRIVAYFTLARYIKRKD